MPDADPTTSGHAELEFIVTPNDPALKAHIAELRVRVFGPDAIEYLTIDGKTNAPLTRTVLSLHESALIAQAHGVIIKTLQDIFHAHAHCDGEACAADAPVQGTTTDLAGGPG